MILVIDNYDSFTYNLVQYIGTLTTDMTVVRNDELTLHRIREMQLEKIVISPGPGIPSQAGISVDVIRELGEHTPIFGICLGHQAITEAYGGKVIRAHEIVHGKTSEIRHEGSLLFRGIPNRFIATRYHSLVADRETFPPDLRITAETNDGLIMALEHRSHPVYGVQFHPESIMTEMGMKIVENFITADPNHFNNSEH